MDYLLDQAEFLANAQPLIKKYRKRIDKVAANVTDFNDHEAATLAILLDNTEQVIQRYARRKNLSDTNYSEAVGPFIKHAFNIISAVYTTLEIKDMISIQPLTQKRGDLYYLQYQYGTTQGQVSEGDYIFSPNNPPTRSGYYGSKVIDQEAISWAGAGLATLAWVPLVGTFEAISIAIVGGAEAGTYKYLSFNSTTNVISLYKEGAGASEAMTINALTGAAELTSGSSAGITGSTGTYMWDSEKYSTSSPIPRIKISVEQIPVVAERNQLLFEIMLDATYDYEKQFGRDLNSEVQAAVIQAIQNQISYRVLGEMYDGSTGNNGTTYTFDMTTPVEKSLVDHSQDLIRLFSSMSGQIYNNLGRGMGNKLTVGLGLATYLKSLPNTMFQRIDNPDIKGPMKIGTLNKDYDVYFNPALPTDEFFMSYKGGNWWEAPYFIGTYLPIMATKFMMFPDLHGEQGYISMEAYENLFPQQVVKGSVTGSGS